MKTLKLKKDVVEQLTSNQANNVKGGYTQQFNCTGGAISNCVCHPMSWTEPTTCEAKPYTDTCISNEGCLSVRICRVTDPCIESIQFCVELTAQPDCPIIVQV